MYKIGIDLGGTNIVAGIVDNDFRLLATDKCKTALPRPADAIVADMAKVAFGAAEKAGVSMDDVEYIGVGSPGVCNRDTGIVENANNMKFDNTPIAAMLGELTGKKVYIENDANAAMLGEVVGGAAKGCNTCVCITLGTGIGGGVLIDGKIYSGFNFAGAELGHTVIVVDGEPCSCGRNGCWEAYASATALIRQTKRAMEAHPESKMWEMTDLDHVSGRTAFDAMRAGDATAKEVVDMYIRYLSAGLVNVINVFQPEKLCIGGGICNEGDALLVPVKEYIKKEVYSINSDKQTELCVAKLGNDAGVIGAAALGIL